MNQFAISKQQIENSPLRSIGIITYPGVEILNIVGPTEVFMFANKALQWEGLTTDPVYKCELLAKDDQPVTTLSGVQVVPANSYRNDVGTLDTLIIPGCEYPQEAMKDAELIECICTHSKNVRRLASICTGAFLLARGGLLDGRRATTHWYFSSSFKDTYPLARLVPDQLFVRDESIWSSGGVTSGIDLAMAMVEEDWGHELALFIARFMVVFHKRPGSQSQFSPYLETTAASRLDFRDLQAWIMENPGKDLRVKALAQRVEMSPRNFARIFLLETGVTPAKYVETVRTDLARHYLEKTGNNVSEIAKKAGFKDTETMRRTFIRHIGVNPVDYRDRLGRKCKPQLPSEVESG